MSQTDPNHLKDLFKQAADIAKQVPDNMQEAAFNRALDMLTGTAPKPGAPKARQSTPPTKSRGRSKSQDEQPAELVTLLSEMNSTEHPNIRASDSVLVRSLNLLKAVLDHHQVDGLAVSDIAKILTDKFRVRTTIPAITMALGRATNLVDRVQDERGYIYRIMKPGEQFLSESGARTKANAGAAKSKRSQKPRANGRAAKPNPDPLPAGKAPESKKSSVSKRPSATASGTSPKAAVTKLIADGFFDAPKSIPQVQQYLQDKRGLKVGSAQLSLAMLRLLRDEVLERNTGADGNYEYNSSKNKS